MIFSLVATLRLTKLEICSPLSCFICILLLFYYVQLGQAITEEDLIAIKEKEDERTIKRCKWTDSYSEIRNEPVMICNNQLGISGLGNSMGALLENMACADIARVHFINIGKIIDQNPVLLRLPTVIVHQNPIIDDFEFVKEMIEVNCPLFYFPWEVAGAWNKRISYLSKILNHTIHQSFPNLEHQLLNHTEFDDILPIQLPGGHPVKSETEPGKSIESHTIRRESDEILFKTFGGHEVNSEAAGTYPFIPDAVILFRCVDILAETLELYGFLNFHIYDKLLPKDTKTIYVLSEPLTYLLHFSYKYDRTKEMRAKETCLLLSKHLLSHLQAIRPNATIGLRRGRSMEGFTQIINAKTVICAPSTFCLWSGMINRNTVYFHPGNLIKERVFLSENFYWINQPPILVFGPKFLHNVGNDVFVELITAPLQQRIEISNFIPSRSQVKPTA